MKLKMLFIALMMTAFASSAFAQFFPARASITILPHLVQAQVFNPYYQPIICNGQVFGRTFNGFVQTTFFAEQIIPVGQYRFAGVYSNGFNQFVYGWANIHCRFAGYW